MENNAYFSSQSFEISEAISQEGHKQMTPTFYMGDKKMEEANGTEKKHPSTDYFTRYLCQRCSLSPLYSIFYLSLSLCRFQSRARAYSFVMFSVMFSFSFYTALHTQVVSSHKHLSPQRAWLSHCAVNSTTGIRTHCSPHFLASVDQPH